ncbi:MAG: long-chain-fatty-acid--CoA ligase [Proteobacteria bacterium]|nr:long-chain-fatty-acid--CoA ligase [Pseudomonadota bacterium]MCZ6783521.1 long-chain-fatty-acid--CoA ligase [Pseudomonadota bacterium]
MSDDFRSVYTDPLTPLSLLERTVRVFPDKIAVVYAGERWTWSQFADRVGRFAGALVRAGVEPGDRVAFLAPNVPDNLAATFAVLLARATLVTINTRLNAHEVSYILNHSGAVVVLVDPELGPLLTDGPAPLSAKPILVNVEDPVAGVTGTPLDGPRMEEFLDGAAPLPVVGAMDDEQRLTSINYTSGTTGRPKGVMYTHRGATLNALGEIIVHGLTRDSVFLWTLPLFHCNGWCFPWAVTAAAGTHVMLRGVDPAEILGQIQQERVTHFNGAPTVLLMIAEAPEARGVRFDPEVRVATGGSPPSPTLLARMEEMGVRVTHLYGLTETYGPHAYCQMQPGWEDLDVEGRAAVMARQGVPYPTATHLRIVDEQMRDVPADGETMGEVVMRGNNVMKGYFEDPEATAVAFAGGWFHSGDLGVVHADGYIELRDRKKDIIISGGENISTIEVEHTVVKHPAVLECAVVASPHEKWGEAPKAFVSLKPGASATEREIIDFCRERLAHFKCPVAVEFTDLPKTSTGKIQKFKLREKEWAGETKRIH